MIWQIGIVLFGVAAVIFAAGYALPAFKKPQAEAEPTAEEKAERDMQEAMAKLYTDGIDSITNYSIEKALAKARSGGDEL